MAKSSTKAGKIKPIREDEPAESQPTDDTHAAEGPEPEPTPEPAPQKKTPKVLSFMQQVGSVAKADWGTRFQIKVYRLAPIIDRLRGSENKYVCIYHEPIDEEKLKLDHGSGRYRLYLNCKSPAAKGEKEIDMIELDILDMNFPPKIPPSEWVDDPRNKQWAWAAPRGSAYHQGGQQPEPAAAANPMQQFETFVKIQDQIQERMPRNEVPDPMAQAEATIAILEKAASLSKPAEGGGVSKFIEQQFAALHTELADARKRQDVLMDKLLDAKTAAPQSNGLGMLKEIISTVKEFAPTLKEMLPEAASAVVRREKEPWYTGLIQTAVEAVGPAMPVLAHGFVQWIQKQPQPQQNPKTIAAGAPAVPGYSTSTAPTEADIWDMLVKALENEASGEDFAESVITLFGKWKYQQACLLGEQGLLQFIQGHAIWNQLGAFQANMPRFIHEFVAYGKDEEDEGSGSEPGELPENPDDGEEPGSRADAPAIEL